MPKFPHPLRASSSNVTPASRTPLEDLATLACFRQTETICYQNQPADHLYRLVSGAARQSTLLPDGRRHIVCFLLPGDFFGLDSKDTHQSSVEALAANTKIEQYSRWRLESLAEVNRDVSYQLREAAFASIRRLQTRMALLAHAKALHRVSIFLLEMSRRSGSDPNVVVLPMSRYDIADYLAIAVETVSRAMTTLRARGAIATAGKRRIILMDRQLLENGDYAIHLDPAEPPASRVTGPPCNRCRRPSAALDTPS